MTLTALDGVGPARISAIIAKLREQQTSIDLLLEYSEADLVSERLLTSSQAGQFVSTENRDKVGDWVARIEERDIQVVPVASSRYPPHLAQALGPAAPAVLYAYGALDLLQTPGVAIAGARDVSPQGIAITETLARSAVESRFTVVSGGARGTDDIAHQAAISSGGGTILALAEGILSPRSKSLLASVDTASTIILSTFLPDDSWQSWRAMERNKYILGLSDRLIVIEAGDKGGTLAAGKEALKRNVPTWVLVYRDSIPSASGNQTLLHLGAQAIPIPADVEPAIPPGLFASDSQDDRTSQQPKLF